MGQTSAGARKAAVTRKGNRERKDKAGRDAQGWTVQERAFVLHYVGAAKFVATEAAVLAGWGSSSRDQARKYASQVMKRPHIIAEIQRIMEERSEKLAITADDVLRELAILKVDAEVLPKSVQTVKARREILKDIGEHVNVGAFRRQVGLSNPNGGPIETVDVMDLSGLSDEELDQLERARTILDRVAGRPPAVPDRDADQGGEGAPPEGT